MSRAHWFWILMKNYVNSFIKYVLSDCFALGNEYKLSIRECPSSLRAHPLNDSPIWYCDDSYLILLNKRGGNIGMLGKYRLQMIYQEEKIRMTSQTENILCGARDMTKCNILFKV